MEQRIQNVRQAARKAMAKNMVSFDAFFSKLSDMQKFFILVYVGCDPVYDKMTADQLYADEMFVRIIEADRKFCKNVCEGTVVVERPDRRSVSGGESLHKQSHGESFMALVENRFYGNGLYILDEPEAALSPMRLMRLMYRIKELVVKNSQFIISTHSPILMTFPRAEVLEITQEGIQSVNYKDTEHFMITKRFMDAPEKIVEDLLG